MFRDSSNNKVTRPYFDAYDQKNNDNQSNNDNLVFKKDKEDLLDSVELDFQETIIDRDSNSSVREFVPKKKLHLNSVFDQMNNNLNLENFGKIAREINNDDCHDSRTEYGA